MNCDAVQHAVQPAHGTRASLWRRSAARISASHVENSPASVGGGSTGGSVGVSFMVGAGARAFWFLGVGRAPLGRPAAVRARGLLSRQREVEEVMMGRP